MVMYVAKHKIISDTEVLSSDLVEPKPEPVDTNDARETVEKVTSAVAAAAGIPPAAADALGKVAGEAFEESTEQD